jgi:organic radical activating enzyme
VRRSYEVVDGKIRSGQCELEVVEHCNLACRSCSHLSPVLARSALEPEGVYRDLRVLARHYHVDRLALLGGEPLLHPDIVGLIEAGRRSGISDLVYVVTNGVLLWRMPEEFWQAVDRVDISIYPGKEMTSEQLAAVRARAAEHGTALNENRVPVFRESYSELGSDDERLVRRIYDTCRVAHVWRCHAVTNGWFFKCPQAYFLPKQLGRENGAHPDGIPIQDSPAFGAALLAYLESPEPLGACQSCLGTVGKLFDHHQVRRADFREHQQRSAEELVDYPYLRFLEHVQPRVEGVLPEREERKLRLRVHQVRSRLPKTGSRRSS